MADSRLFKLTKLFTDTINGRKDLKNARDGRLFIEGLCANTDHATCVHRITTSAKGLSSIQVSMRFDTSIKFLNGEGAEFLKYMQDPSIASIDSGSVLASILKNVVEPPFFWDAFTKAFKDGALSTESCHAFAWLLLQLITLPQLNSSSHLPLAKSPDILDAILKSTDGATRIFGEKIKHALPMEPLKMYEDVLDQPGGRHNNDHADHRLISVMPTADELLSKDRPFLRVPDYLKDDELASSRSAIHLDNQFRMLREDMLGEIREEMKILTKKKPGRHRGVALDVLRIAGIDMGTEKKRVPWAITFEVKIPHLKNIKPEKWASYLKDNQHILRHRNIACLFLDGEPVAFPTIHREVDQLARKPSVATLQFQDDSTLTHALLKLKSSGKIQLVELDTATFAYEPFLTRLQEMKRIPLGDELLHWDEGKPMKAPDFEPKSLTLKLEDKVGKDLKALLSLNKSARLDHSQMEALIRSLKQRISLVQGPPGTGKSFIGALSAKAIHDHTDQVILVICFTNHALDQFLEDLLDIGIPPQDMIRLGGKSTDRTKPLTMREQTNAKLPQSHWRKIDEVRSIISVHETRLSDAFKRYNAMNFQKQQVMDYLEFLEDDLPYFDAFTLPEDDGMTRVGRMGGKMGKFYLLERWISGSIDAGSIHDLQPSNTAEIWKMSRNERGQALGKWQDAILEDHIREIQESGRDFNKNQTKLAALFGERDETIIKNKRIIGCTTNAAAKYAAAIQSATPGVVLVEEAGEILEAHILTALGPQTQQLILIGDHKQLRPKCSYELSVEQGDGFDFNRSLFERLFLDGFPHSVLSEQHRMRPEISSMIRHLTYPDLTDARSTHDRPNLRGFRDNIMWLNHEHPEEVLSGAQELRDGKTSSKQNKYEARMILKTVKYLAQQGYGADKLVVLTPYLGQLKLLRDELLKENDPVLNDIDRYELLKAGLLTDVSSKKIGPSLRISTIDNYQGEESEIVLVSMTRSNKSHDIGFMQSPERLNVLLSRARDGLIMIGNAETFMKARKGKEIWCKFFDHLKEHNHIYEGLPVKCEKHLDRTAILTTPDDFELNCPDGGCKEPCNAILKCNVHKCPSRCHQLVDHSKIRCMAILKQKCPKGHSQNWHCHTGPAPLTCTTCEREIREAGKKAQRQLREKQQRDEQEAKHLNELAKVQEEIDRITESMKDVQLSERQAAILAQKKQDLFNAKELAAKRETTSQQPPTANTTRLQSPKSVPGSLPANSNGGSSPKTSFKNAPSFSPSTTPKATSTDKNILKKYITTIVPHNDSLAKIEWQRQKDQEGAINPSIDDIMEMTGLEEVKIKILSIKAKVELAIRQNTDLNQERLGLVLVGNPGTGKTTVARHYAKVLSSLQVIEGHGFVETTGSKLAHGGIAEVKDNIKDLANSDGGVYFIDEAYQLAEGNATMGKAVLDYLLAEIEDLTGSVVFVFAGYRRNMEKFFEHNPGFKSRIPHELIFEDYTDNELLIMLQSKVVRFYKKSGITIEDGPDGLYMNVAVKRLGRGRGRDGFGNARALENMFARVRERQAERLTKERKNGLLPDDFMIVKDDLIGPDPSLAIMKCPAWDKLQNLTGLRIVKESINFMIDLIKTNYKRELDQKEPVQVALNRVFLGSPGTGKTTVAKLYGQILADLGLLSNGEVVTKNPADFIGQHIGESEAKTKAILANTVGKVLIIDEAYMLHSSSIKGGNTDSFKTAVIDTIVAEVQSVPGEDRCVLLLGYEDEMKSFFQNVNPGLTRRFQLSDAFKFEDFTDSELQEILEFKLQTQQLGADQAAIKVALDVLGRARMGLNFGNGGDVENLISTAKKNYQQRQSALPLVDRSIDFNFEPRDFDPDFERAAAGESNLHKLFEGVIGCEAIIDKLDGFLKVAKGMRAQGLDPRTQIPMNFVFKGPPGTGKTTTARKLGQVYFDLGLIGKVEVEECSASDMIAEYVGHTGPKTVKMLEKGLGKVLFVDEAYQLGEGRFAQEAVNALVDTMTKPKFHGKMIIILAGYSGAMNDLLRVNEGLSSRFADEIIFPSLSAEYSLQLLISLLRQQNIVISGIHETSTYSNFLKLVTDLSKLPAWGNARDIQTLTKSMVRAAYSNNTEKVALLVLPAAAALNCVHIMLVNRQARQTGFSKTPKSSTAPEAYDMSNQTPAPSLGASSASAAAASQPKKGTSMPPKLSQPNEDGEPRDDGISDAIWEQLQKDKKAASLVAKENAQQLRKKQEEAARVKKAEVDAAVTAAALKAEQDKNDAEFLELFRRQADAQIHQQEEELKEMRKRDEKNRADSLELLRQRELARIQELQAKAENERVQNELRRQYEEDQKRKQREQQVQQKLREMGVCIAGFRWIKQSGGYRCAGGSHYVSDSQLGM